MIERVCRTRAKMGTNVETELASSTYNTQVHFIYYTLISFSLSRNHTMKRSSAVTSPPSLSLFLLLLLPLLAQSSDDLIDKICRVTPFIDLCEASLRPLTPSPSDPKSLASAMASVVLGNMTDTLGYIQSLIRHSHDPAAERALAQCAELYRPVVKFNIPQAIDAMRRGELGFATYVLGDAEKQTDTCQKWINSAGADDENSVALTARNKQVKNLCDVAISVIKSLMKGR
ncbi:hypothetical protein YC2023_062016 [Brassica napus]